MNAALQLLKRVPAWVWIFVATTQVLTVAARLHELPKLNSEIEQVKATPVQAGYERIRSQKQKDLIIAIVLGPTSMGLAIWKLASDRKSNRDSAALVERTNS